MADAESNLVPSEAADQVEVALEKQAAADDGILYLNEYQYENDLVTDFARLVASPRRRGSLYVAAAIAALIGIGMLVDNSVVVIEHNLDVIKTADYIIDIGPEGGDGGGRIIAQGTPEQVAKVKESYTAKYLKQKLA